MATSKSSNKSAKSKRRRGSGKLQFLTQDELKRLFAVITYAQLTNPRRDDEARKLFADHRVV